MPLSQVQVGMNCTGYTVVSGTTITSFDVQVMGVVSQAGQGARILVSVSGPAVAQSGVAQGFSGSPVYCDSNGTPENIGAISEGIGQYGNNVVLVTPIQQMLGEPVKPPSSAPRLRADARPLLGPLTVGGLAPSLLSVLQRAGQRAGRQIVAAPAGPPPSFPVQQLVPGAAVAVSYSNGAIPIGAIGTVTYRNGPDVYLFGHELDGAGRRSLLLQDAYVYGVIDNPDPATAPSYKLAAPGQTLGTVTSDTPNGVIGELGAGPSQIPVTVTAHNLDTGDSIVESTDVADESAIGFPLGSSLLDTIAPIAVGQAAIDAFNGPPASESGSMCLEVNLREHHATLRFCNRYVGTGPPGDGGVGPPEIANSAALDVTSGLALLDSVQFTTLHVASVTAHIDTRAGLTEAAILGASGPHNVTPGERVTVHVRIRRYRSSTSSIALKVRIPRDAQGTFTVEIKGAAAPSTAPGPGLASALGAVLSGAVPSTPSPPSSLSELRTDFAAIPSYDGVEVKIAHGRPEPAYRDPSLLITGDATLSVTSRGSQRHRTGTANRSRPQWGLHRQLLRRVAR
jgi:hypothetical protein